MLLFLHRPWKRRFRVVVHPDCAARRRSSGSSPNAGLKIAQLSRALRTTPFCRHYCRRGIPKFLATRTTWHESSYLPVGFTPTVLEVETTCRARRFKDLRTADNGS